MQMKKLFFSLGVGSLILLSGCQSTGYHLDQVRADQSERALTVGRVQKEIRVGMTNTEVIEALGSPNMVTTDEERREVWVYDKIATESAQSSNSGGINILILGVRGSSGAASTTQRTLTVVIKFDNANKVRDFAYQTSRF
jgi:outer membrane protein assembly factor BamE (lipoprotein component of BamABCDE complex)